MVDPYMGLIGNGFHLGETPETIQWGKVRMHIYIIYI
jgi:hypothetical protein